jgi:lipoic acid synthetase
MALPTHLKKRLPKGPHPGRLRALVSTLALETICDEARCPNRVECFADATASFLLMGRICTRRCGFCSVETGRPRPLDSEEPRRVAEAVRRLRLRHAVITSVDRDDLPDGGAAHFAATVRAIHAVSPGTVVEVLTPDFEGNLASVDAVLEAAPEVFNHNVETVLRLYPRVRHRGDFERSLGVLRHAKERSPRIWTKSGLMAGLGETPAEMIATFRALRERGLVDLLTVGQYLRPTKDQVPVAEYLEPAQFDRYGAAARAMGFTGVFSGPFVRSSYLADRVIPLDPSRRASL